jgi:excisionase family DNA binding protein
MMNAISTLDAARLMGLTRVRVWQFIRDGHLEAKKFGSVYCIKPKHLHAFISQRNEEKEKKE